MRVRVCITIKKYTSDCLPDALKNTKVPRATVYKCRAPLFGSVFSSSSSSSSSFGPGSEDRIIFYLYAGTARTAGRERDRLTRGALGRRRRGFMPFSPLRLPLGPHRIIGPNSFTLPHTPPSRRNNTHREMTFCWRFYLNIIYCEPRTLVVQSS